MDDTQVLRQAVQARDWMRCVRCGHLLTWKPGHVHHRVLGNRSQNAAWNLILLCSDCHGFVHAHPVEAATDGYIVSRFWAAPESVPVVYNQPGRTGLFTLGDDLTTSAWPVP
jgi:hypothetical protein